MAANQLPQKVVQLRDKAQEHKRKEGQERRAGRRTMAELRLMCAELGIDFKEVKPHDRVPGKGQSHSSSN